MPMGPDGKPVEQPEKPTVIAQGANWRVGNMGALEVTNNQGVPIAEFAGNQWAWVERS
jgi:hypothetical protein